LYCSFEFVVFFARKNPAKLLLVPKETWHGFLYNPTIFSQQIFFNTEKSWVSYFLNFF
jgi:hypothetical protein